VAKGIYRRGDGQYQVKIRQGGRTLSETFETFEAAREWREITVGAVTGRTYVDRDREARDTLWDILGRYLEEVTPSKKGHRQEESRMRQWMAEEWARLPIISIEPSHIVQWRKLRLAEGKAPSTISNAMNLLSAVFKIAIAEWGYKVANPCIGIRRPPARPGREAHLSAADEAALLAACEAGPMWLIWFTRLAIETAARAGELRGLEWKHVFDTHLHLPRTKNGAARDVPLTEEALAVVQGLREALPRRKGGDDWVFGDPKEPRLDYGGFPPWLLTHAFRDAVARAQAVHGMSVRLTFHDLRHVGATRLAPIHRDALDLAKTTGHKGLRMLARYYNPEISERAAELRARKKALKPAPS
jgi:integrase